jgi:hypothetical protein
MGGKSTSHPLIPSRGKIPALHPDLCNRFVGQRWKWKDTISCTFSAHKNGSPLCSRPCGRPTISLDRGAAACRTGPFEAIERSRSMPQPRPSIRLTTCLCRPHQTAQRLRAVPRGTIRHVRPLKALLALCGPYPVWPRAVLRGRCSRTPLLNAISGIAHAHLSATPWMRAVPLETLEPAHLDGGDGF